MTMTPNRGELTLVSRADRASLTPGGVAWN